MRARRLILWAAVGAALCVVLALLLWRTAERPEPSDAKEDAEQEYTVEQFHQPTPREEGMAWCNVERVLRV